MKKSILTFALAIFSICAFSQNLFTFSIDAVVYSSDGNDVKSGAIFSFAPVNAFASTESITMNVLSYTSKGAKTKGEDKVWFCTDPNARIKTKITSVTMPIASPKQICYGELLSWLQNYLEDIYGQGNVTVIQ